MCRAGMILRRCSHAMIPMTSGTVGDAAAKKRQNNLVDFINFDPVTAALSKTTLKSMSGALFGNRYNFSKIAKSCYGDKNPVLAILAHFSNEISKFC